MIATRWLPGSTETVGLRRRRRVVVEARTPPDVTLPATSRQLPEMLTPAPSGPAVGATRARLDPRRCVLAGELERDRMVEPVAAIRRPAEAGAGDRGLVRSMRMVTLRTTESFGGSRSETSQETFVPLVSTVKCLVVAVAPGRLRETVVPIPHDLDRDPVPGVAIGRARRAGVAQGWRRGLRRRPASASVAATASTTHFTAAALPTRAWPPISASRLPSAAPAGLLLRAARGATASPRCPATPGRKASTRTNRLGSAGSARRSGRDAGVSRRTRAGFDSTFGFGLVCRWVVVDGVAAGTDGCCVTAGAWGATCVGGAGVDCCGGVVFLASGAGSGATAGACGAASGCGSAAEAVPKIAQKASEKTSTGNRRPGAAEMKAARSRMRRGAFGSKRFILLDSRRLSQRRPGPVRCQRAIRNLAFTGSE